MLLSTSGIDKYKKETSAEIEMTKTPQTEVKDVIAV